MDRKEEAPAIRILKEAGEDARCLEYDFVERGGTKDAARQLGLCEHEIVKSLVFDDGQGNRAVMALMHGDERVSLHKLQRLSGVPHLQPS
uniref:YbaK/EbsC family protein n=1 Tax=uncultured Bilophila sp. TaxID=529385 RepID=UPI00280B2D88